MYERESGLFAHLLHLFNAGGQGLIKEFQDMSGYCWRGANPRAVPEVSFENPGDSFPRAVESLKRIFKHS